MKIVICPGIHEAQLTNSFLSGLQGLIPTGSNLSTKVNILIYPYHNFLSLSGIHIFQFLQEQLKDKLESPVVFIGFSAGVVGAMFAAWKWQMWTGNVKAFIAIDGWGVPVCGNFPIHRISHDDFTHWSSKILGSGDNNFYADPPVEHLEIWRSPQKVPGWWVDSLMGEAPAKRRLSAGEFLYLLLEHYVQN
ncbi:MAG: hypothetical protein QNJ47_01195 [Nostocaceae cyanobacterium]|nr:hypothetical protein [Nostocaceae cyanobacterium]